ncbi:hypothetical protein CDD80_1972 [Ophiocordyceps camponoti-rufipedis]|uniref:Mob1/phocein family protein n=1 Tax=Ophiocordyceps camponoti-rufipedis TaxID=2004952 RepID=A0A2C5ZKG7_9HYPO|nr:hypothetical protein CDD80_1972 [Ophiocordyceps camponoti-rufipedis]
MALAPSSPRLPSPPPAAEIQIGPKSPSGGTTVSPQAMQMEQTVLDARSKRRIHPGTKAADMAAGPPLVPLGELDSAFQLQEHLSALHYHYTASATQAITRETALQLAHPPPGIDRSLWLYELCRFLIAQCNSLIVGFLFDDPPCCAETCPEMRASEWQFLCAVHEQPKSCCAIDYCCHTLDWAANVVSDQKIFPSRFVALSDSPSKNVGVKNLINVFRRLHRIFAHAWFQHRTVFWTVEGQAGLYVFFKTVCDLYDLLPSENYKLPPEAEGLEAPTTEPEPQRPTPTILKPPLQHGDDDGLHSIGRTNTRRHIRSSPSTGSAVTTVLETDEEDADAACSKMRDLDLSEQDQAAEDEPEMAEVPVIVEQCELIDAIASDSSDSEDLPMTEAEKTASIKADEELDETTDASNVVPGASSPEHAAHAGPPPGLDPQPGSPLASTEHPEDSVESKGEVEKAVSETS